MKTRNLILLMLASLALITSSSAEVRVDSLSIDPYHIEAGDKVDIYVKIHESLIKRDVWSGGTSTDKGYQVTQDDPDVFYYAELMASTDLTRDYITFVEGTRRIGHLFPGESWTIPFSIKVSEDAPSADYELEVDIMTKNAKTGAEDSARSYAFTVHVKGVVKFNVEAENTLTVGKVNKVKLRLSNMGSGKAKHVTVSANASTPLTVLDAGEVYIGAMKGGDKSDIKFNVNVDSDAKLGSYEIPIKIEYVSEGGEKMVIPQKIGVRVDGTPDISIVLDSEDDLKSGSSGEVVLNIVNNGFIDAKFLTVRLKSTEDYTVTSSAEKYIGNLASDDFENQEFMIDISKTAEAGSMPLKVVLEYKKDNSNTLETMESTVNVNILSESEYLKVIKSNGSNVNAKTMLLAIPGLIIVYLLIWFTVKVIGAVTDLLNRKLFKRGLE